MLTCTGFAFLFVSITCTPSTAPPADTFCMIAKPIMWSSRDTRATKEAVDIHNRKWARLCRERK